MGHLVQTEVLALELELDTSGLLLWAAVHIMDCFVFIALFILKMSFEETWI